MTPDPDELPFQRQVIYTTRPCLKCRKDFQSEGKHNRICERCERQNKTESSIRVIVDHHQRRKGVHGE